MAWVGLTRLGLTRSFPATAGVARAVGAQGSIIGPTHAISAALTSLKGAARRVRMASAAPSVPSSALSDHNDVNRNGNGSGSGSGNDGENEYGADGSQRAAIDTAVLPASTAAMVPIERQQQQQQQHEESASPDEGVMAEDGGGGEDGYVPSAAAAVAMVVGQSGDFVFEDEAGRYGMMLEAMMRGAVAVSFYREANVCRSTGKCCPAWFLQRLSSRRSPAFRAYGVMSLELLT